MLGLKSIHVRKRGRRSYTTITVTKPGQNGMSAVSNFNIKTVFPGMANVMIKIRRSRDPLFLSWESLYYRRVLVLKRPAMPQINDGNLQPCTTLTEAVSIIPWSRISEKNVACAYILTFYSFRVPSYFPTYKKHSKASCTIALLCEDLGARSGYIRHA